MSFKINLKPNPAAEYFTVREHQRAFGDTSASSEELFLAIDQKIKQLFNIPLHFQSYFINKSNLLKLTEHWKVMIKDNPLTGIDELLDNTIELPISTIDLSYSFPQIPSSYSSFNTIIIDPAMSLGIPADFVLVLTEQDLNSIDQRSDEISIRSLNLLNLVLDDFLHRGIDVLLRESNYKAAVLHQMIEDSPPLNPVAEKSNRSKTMILAECEPDFLDKIEKMGYELGRVKTENSTVMAIANYPTHSKELIEMFADRVAVL